MKATTLAELKKSGYRARSVKDEVRENLIAKLKAKEPIFQGVIGYEDTVVPQVVNALLAQQNFILLGLRGQAKSRILRAITDLLDEEVPYILGTELHDDPLNPVSSEARNILAEHGDKTQIAWLPRAARYVEKLATPDVTVADMIGDVDPIKAARMGQSLGNELTVHYGLLPRANRGIFAVNELADLSPKVAVIPLQHLARIHQSLRVERVLDPVHEFHFQRGLALLDLVALQLPEAVLCRDRAVQARDDPVNNGADVFASCHQRTRGSFIRHADVVVQVAVADVAEDVADATGEGLVQRRHAFVH